MPFSVYITLEETEIQKFIKWQRKFLIYNKMTNWSFSSCSRIDDQNPKLAFEEVLTFWRDTPKMEFRILSAGFTRQDKNQPWKATEWLVLIAQVLYWVGLLQIQT